MTSRVSLVTGSSRGIGREVAQELAARGHDVIVTSRTGDAARAATEIGARYSQALDTTDGRSIEAIVRYIGSTIGRLDVLVNNAGVLLDEGESIIDVDPAKFEETWRANTLGPFLMTQRLVPLLRASGNGRVVNVSSGAGQLSSMASCVETLPDDGPTGLFFHDREPERRRPGRRRHPRTPFVLAQWQPMHARRPRRLTLSMERTTLQT